MAAAADPFGERDTLSSPAGKHTYYSLARLEKQGLGAISRIFSELRHPARVWCRIRTGAGAMGAIPVRSPAQARHWIEYWRDMRGVPPGSFLLSEYLPGRDFGCQSLWKDGEMVLVKTYERLSYLGTGSRPALVSSVAALAKTVFTPAVVDACAKAIRAVDARASGVFSTDLKEDARGVPCVTEVNAGRFSSATNIFDLAGKHNMAATYVQLALGEPVTLREEYDVVEDCYMLRDIDNPPRMFHAREFFEGVEDRLDSRRGRTDCDRPRDKEEERWRTYRSTTDCVPGGPTSASRRPPRAGRRKHSLRRSRPR